MGIIPQIIFLVLNIAIGKYQAYRFDVKQKRINHTTWAIWYCLLLIPVWYFTRNWWLVAACGIQHLPVFNTFLNWFRKPARPIFYTHPEDPFGSKLDKLWGKYYPVVFFISIVLLVILQFFI
jgi:hypothetical protein